MNNKVILYFVSGLVLGLLLGFVLTNALNRQEHDKLRAEVERSRASTLQREASATSSTQPSALTDDEIRRAIETADARPDDIYLQKRLGQSLYSYAVRTPDASAYLPDIARLLKRACDADSQDHDALLSLANVCFDIAQKTSDAAHFTESRRYYEKALTLKPNDADARTDLGLTYYLAQPSDPQRAIAEYRRALTIDPRHETTLQNMATALIVVGNRSEAQKVIEQLERINRDNSSLPDLRARLAQNANSIEH